MTRLIIGSREEGTRIESSLEMETSVSGPAENTDGDIDNDDLPISTKKMATCSSHDVLGARPILFSRRTNAVSRPFTNANGPSTSFHGCRPCLYCGQVKQLIFLRCFGFSIQCRTAFNAWLGEHFSSAETHSNEYIGDKLNTAESQILGAKGNSALTLETDHQ